MELWKEFDCIDMFKKNLKEAGILTDTDFVDTENAIRTHITRIMQLAVSDQLSPRSIWMSIRIGFVILCFPTRIIMN